MLGKTIAQDHYLCGTENNEFKIEFCKCANTGTANENSCKSVSLLHSNFRMRLIKMGLYANIPFPNVF